MVKMKIYCPIMETYVEINHTCSLKLGSGDGTLTAVCPYKNTKNCPLKTHKPTPPKTPILLTTPFYIIPKKKEGR